MDINKTACILIDMQKEPNYDLIGLNEVIENAKALTDYCRSMGIPVIYTRHINREDAVGVPYKEPLDEQGNPIFYNAGTDAIEIFDEIKPQKKDIVIDKHRWSAFYQTNLNLILNSLNVKHILIGGLVTDGCLMTSVFDAFFNDYQVNLIKDTCSTTSIGGHMASILIMCNWVYGLNVYNTSGIIKKLNGEEHKAWEWVEADQLQFTPEDMREVFKELEKNEE